MDSNSTVEETVAFTEAIIEAVERLEAPTPRDIVIYTLNFEGGWLAHRYGEAEQKLEQARATALHANVSKALKTFSEGAEARQKWIESKARPKNPN